MQKNKLVFLSKFWIGLSIFAMSYAILKLSESIINVNNNVPLIVEEIHKMNQNIDSITSKSIPDVLATIPEIIQQIDEFQTQIQAFKYETEHIRNHIVPNTLIEIRRFNDQIPNAINVVTNIDKTSIEALKRVDSIDKKIPSILTTINNINDSLSNYMQRAELLVDQADKVAKTAGNNVTKGILGGIVTTPYRVAKGAGTLVLGDAKNINEQDKNEMITQTISFLNQNSTNYQNTWSNIITGSFGQISVLKSYEYNGINIKKVKITFNSGNIRNKVLAHFYQNHDDTWSLWK